MTTICVFPECGHPAYDQNRAGQPACAGHVRVVVGSSDDLGKADDKHADRTEEW